ncbi:MAG TPA: YdiU family protein [Fontimonas sp.]
MNVDQGASRGASGADAALRIAFDNSYARDLEGAYAPVQPQAWPAARLLLLNEGLADELGVPVAALRGPAGLGLLSGNALPEGATPIAQAYAGHQFGGFSAQLGDGRAMLVGELIDRHGQRRDIAFKGSGRTPFSRGGDGRAALGPVLREYLIGEAMQALGIPTTRALAVIATGEQIRRDRPLPGALLVRVASSHLRVGTFEFFAARRDEAMLRRLLAYAVARHAPEWQGRADAALGLLQSVVRRQAALVAQWMGVGFIHGVMNTDNMTISGETIDYGPCAFLEHYDPAAVFSSIDEGGRYAYGNQPGIAQWNLARLAEALLPLIEADEQRAIELATGALQDFTPIFGQQWLGVMRRKLALGNDGDDEADRALVEDLLSLMQSQRVDWTLGWRQLPADGVPADAWLARFGEASVAAGAWLERWQRRLATESRTLPAGAALAAANPAVVPRNHHVEAALAAAGGGDLQPFEALLAAIRRPFDAQQDNTAFAEPAARDFTACYRTFCGT